jgi:ParB-like chromosome segregation protein Spo0J
MKLSQKSEGALQAVHGGDGNQAGDYPNAGRQIVSVPISALLPGDSPRLEGQDDAHIARLAEIDTPLPPILVDRRGMWVIDGMHRLLAAMLRGQESIEVEFFDGTEEDAFLRAVQSNVAHGFPLSQADRRAAVTRIMSTHPHMSDRAIADAAGLGRRTVAAIRRCSTGTVPQLNTRIGKDGRVRPLSSVEGRQKAADVMTERPQASLREVAHAAGVSLATASDVRKRLSRGEEPVPSRAATVVAGDDGTASEAVRRGPGAQRASPPDPAPMVEKLLRDPSLRLSETGRQLLRLLRNQGVGAREWSEMVAAVPPHCGPLVMALAAQYAQRWVEFAERLGERSQSTSPAVAPAGPTRQE